MTSGGAVAQATQNESGQASIVARPVSHCEPAGETVCSLYERRIAVEKIVAWMGRRQFRRIKSEHTLRRLMYGALRMHGVPLRYPRVDVTYVRWNRLVNRHFAYFPNCPLKGTINL